MKTSVLTCCAFALVATCAIAEVEQYWKGPEGGAWDSVDNFRRHAGFVVAPKAQTVSAGTYSVLGAEAFVLHYLTT